VVLASFLIAGSAWLASAVGATLFRQAEPVAGLAPASEWQRWTGAHAADLLDAGQPVFVDFTAAWCVTCQYNKKFTLSRPAVMAAFAEKKVSLLRADWTQRDPEITTALRSIGRSGVPAYVLLLPGRPPVVLAEMLSETDIRRALSGI
jgi:thiol:disulfide interchange protein DsbD